MITDEIRPEQIDLTLDEFRINLAHIQNFSNEAALYYENSKEKMLDHLRGNLLNSHTSVHNIENYFDKKLVATQLIPQGSIIGLYFGKLYPLDEPEFTLKQWDITKYEHFRDHLGNLMETNRVIGELDGKLTRMARINHAYPKDRVLEMYTFTDDKIIDQIGTQNLELCQFNITLYTKTVTRHIQLTGYIASQNICEGEALLMAYDNPSKLTPNPGYWESRNSMPSLFTKSGDYLPRSYYKSKSLPLFPAEPEDNEEKLSLSFHPERFFVAVIFIIIIALFLKWQIFGNPINVQTETSDQKESVSY